MAAQSNVGSRRAAGGPVVPSAVLGGFLGGIFKGGDAGEKTRQIYADKVALINGLEDVVKRQSDEQLRAKTAEFKGRAAAGESLDDILPVGDYCGTIFCLIGMDIVFLALAVQLCSVVLNRISHSDVTYFHALKNESW